MYTIAKRSKKSKAQQFSILDKQRRGRKRKNLNSIKTSSLNPGITTRRQSKVITINLDDSDDSGIDIIENENSFPKIQNYQKITHYSIDNTERKSNIENASNNPKNHITVIDDDDYIIPSTKIIPDSAYITTKTVHTPVTSTTVQIPSHISNSDFISAMSTPIFNGPFVPSSLSTSSPKSTTSISTNIFTKSNVSSNSLKFKHQNKFTTNDNIINSISPSEKSNPLKSSNKIKISNSSITSPITTIRNETKNILNNLDNSQISNNNVQSIDNSINNTNNNKLNTCIPKSIFENKTMDISLNTGKMKTSMEVEASMIPNSKMVFDDKINSDVNISSSLSNAKIKNSNNTNDHLSNNVYNQINVSLRDESNTKALYTNNK